ncbi:MAG: MFS transporter [Gemmobacter sp.]
MSDEAKGRMILLAAGMATYFLMGALQAVYGPALPVLSRETGRSISEVSMLFSVHWIGSAAGVAAMFALGNRMTPRLSVLSLACGAGLLGAGLGWSVTLLGAGLAGLGQGCAAVVFNPRLLALFGRRGPAMLSLINALFGAGAILAPLAFVAVGGAYGLVFLALGAALLVVVLGAQDVGRAPPAQSASALRPDWVILGLGAFGIGFEASLIGLGPTALIRAGASEAHAAELLSAFFVAFLLARVALTLGAHLIAPFLLYLISVAGVAGCMAAAVVLPPDWLFVLAGAFAATIFPGYFVEGMVRMGNGARVAPLVVAGGLAGGIVMPWVLARLVEDMGPRGFFAVMAGLALAVTLTAGLVLLLRAAPARRRA